MSVRVDFYILAQADEQSGWQFACKLAEKAYNQKQRMFIFCENQTAAHRFDELLWTFNDISFVPHLLQGETAKYTPPIYIGYQESPTPYPILLNLAPQIPHFYQQYNRVIEIVCGDEPMRQQTRERYKHYRAELCEMYTHQMDQY